VRDSALDEDVVVRRQLLDRAGRRELEAALEDVEGLLEGVQVQVDAAARAKLGDDDLLVDGAGAAVDQRPARVAFGVPGVAAGERRRLAEAAR